MARLDKILPILSHNLRRVAGSAAYPTSIISEFVHESSLHNGQQSSLLTWPPGPATTTTATASFAPATQAEAWSRLIESDKAGHKQQNATTTIVIALEATKRLVRSCWAKSPLDRPQSVAHIRQLLDGGLLKVLSHLSYLEAKRCQRNPRWFPCCSWPGSGRAHAHKGALNQNAFALELYAKLIEETSRERSEALAHQSRISSELRSALLPKTIQSLAAHLNLESQNQSTASCIAFEKVHLCTFRLLFVTGANNMTSKCIELEQLKALTEFLGDFDQLIGSFRGHLNLWDSQADSLSRFTIYAGDILTPISRSATNFKQSNSQCPLLTDFKHTRLVTTFAFELIDLINRYQTKSGVCLQVKIALHAGPIAGSLLMARGDEFVSRPGVKSGSGYMKLARLIPLGRTMQILEALEQTSQPQRIQISAEMRSALLELPEERGVVTISSDQQVSRLKLIPEILRGGAHLGHDDLFQQQGYVMMKRTNKIKLRNAELDTYWLLNGPRVTASQRLMLPIIDQV